MKILKLIGKDLITNRKYNEHFWFDKNFENINTNESIQVGLKEFQILEYLMQNKGIVVSKEQIYDKIWGLDSEIESNNLEAYLSFIRKKLKLIDCKVNIKVMRGIGYKLEVQNEKVSK